MSDQQQDNQDAVRRVLAEAGAAPEPMPEQVVSRLDGVLADLVAERAGGSDAGRDNVVPLAPRRRWPSRLVAAAAVCVVVAGVGTVLAHNHGTTTTAESQAASGAAEHPRRSAAAGGAALPQATTSTPDFAGQDKAAMGALPKLHRSTMAKDLRRVSARAATLSTHQDTNRALLACPALTARERESWIPARLGQRVVAVLVGPVHSGKREVRVLSCETRSAPLAAYAVPTP